MKKINCLVSFVIISFYCHGQASHTIKIQSGDALFLFTETTEGKVVMTLNSVHWDKLVAGTKYISANLPFTTPQLICLEIANKEQGHCKSGIGFSCSIFDCGPASKPASYIVNNENRICSVNVTKQCNGQLEILFLDKIDWTSLQNIPYSKKSL